MAAFYDEPDLRKYLGAIRELHRAMDGAPDTAERRRLAAEVARLEDRVRQAERDFTTCTY